LVGTGPFKFVEWTGPLGEISFVRNDDYNWAPEIYNHNGPAYLDGFVIKGIVEPGTRRSAMESGSVDVTYLQSSDKKAFEGVDGFIAWAVPKQGTARIFNFNLEHPITSDIRVRQAFSHAIDREGLVNSPTFGGVDKAANAFLSSATWGESTDEFAEFNYAYDPDKAMALLDEVGWKDEDGDGIREAHGVEGVEDGTPLVLVEAANANVREQSVVVQGMLNKVGIQTDMIVNDYGTMAGLRRSGDYDFTIMSNSGSHFWLIEGFFHTREIGGNNYSRYSNPEVDAWFDEASGTVDLARQRELFTMIQKQMLQDIPAFPGWDIMYAWAMKDTVHDITTDSSAVGAYLYDTWME
jgi:peptide/nickel transport system substrate-binding protein